MVHNEKHTGEMHSLETFIIVSKTLLRNRHGHPKTFKQIKPDFEYHTFPSSHRSGVQKGQGKMLSYIEAMQTMIDYHMLDEISLRLCVEVEMPHIMQATLCEAFKDENAVAYSHGRVELTWRKSGGWTW